MAPCLYKDRCRLEVEISNASLLLTDSARSTKAPRAGEKQHWIVPILITAFLPVELAVAWLLIHRSGG